MPGPELVYWSVPFRDATHEIKQPETQKTGRHKILNC
jgi:hypothetical protein